MKDLSGRQITKNAAGRWICADCQRDVTNMSDSIHDDWHRHDALPQAERESREQGEQSHRGAGQYEHLRQDSGYSPFDANPFDESE